MYGSMGHRHILTGNQDNLIMAGAPRIVHIFGLEPQVNGMMRAVPVLVLDLYAKQIYIERVQPVLAEKLHY